MNDQSLSIGRSSDFPQHDQPAAPKPSIAPYGSRWSLVVSGVCAGILVAALGAVLWFSVTLPKLQRFEDPDRALDLMVSRTLDAQDSLRRAPTWQQWMADWTMGSDEEAREQAIQWYRELVETTDDPLSKIRLAILLGESGQEAAALAETKRWQDRGTSALLFGQLIDAAYGTQPLDRTQEIELQAVLAETLPSGWFYDHLAARLARRAGNQDLLVTVEEQSARREDRVQQWIRPLISFESICLVMGSLLLLGVARLRGQRMNILRLHGPGVPPPWSGGTAGAVILRGGALGVVTTALILSTPSFQHVSLRALAIPLANLPLLVLAYIQLLKPAGLTFTNGFGLGIKRDDLGRLTCTVLAVVAAGLWGEWVMGRAAEFLHLNNHWTEWFDKDLVWGTPPVIAVSILEYVVFAPIFEELAFRGLLFAMLRRRFKFLPAALISTSLFALAHGYSLIGFVSVFWSGFLWAWIYERTGSLIPGMVAHAMNNLLVCLTVMALLR
ncbi:MAG: CPBP family intramembrane glutamic endopeptidase [Nitrospira sp.]|nr:MAG: CPBP family intramembrane metalloprotease [Nitrospira sp.]